MAIKKLTSKAVEVIKTIKVGRPALKSSVIINVLGIEFEQGSDFEFGKCRYNQHGFEYYVGAGGLNPVQRFILDNGIYIIWNIPNGGVFANTSQQRADQFLRHFEILDWDTEEPVEEAA